MESEEHELLQACSLPLPPDNDFLEYIELSDDESDVEDYLVYDEVTQVCVICEVVLRYSSHGPYCERCHSFMYPDFTLLQKEFDNIRKNAGDREVTVKYNRRQCSGFRKCDRPRHRCGKDGSHKNESVNKSLSPWTNSRTNYCFSDSEDEDCELLGLAQLSIYDNDFIRFNATCLREEETTIVDDFVEQMPTEILLHIFSYLDDLGLCKVAQVCQRWRMLSDNMGINWNTIVEKRWQLFRPIGVVACWRDLYVKMVEATTCVPCLEEGYVTRVMPDDVPNVWRNKRLRSELKQLLIDPPEGIRACPVDDEYSNWQASIAGPPDSVYENGIFYLHLELPRCYPMMPPRVRFLTRILHPNVNRHGDIGIDCIRDNWSLALTIPKILVSIQSLLTDPYCHVCMEHTVARMYTEDREYFNIVARNWTRKFAQHHFQNPELKPQTIW